jgi:acyl carrier protein
VSFDAVEIRLHVEEEFGIEFSDNEAEAIRTVGELFQTVMEHYGAREPSRSIAYSEPSLEKVIEIVALQLGIRQDKVTADSRFEDLYS